MLHIHLQVFPRRCEC